MTPIRSGSRTEPVRYQACRNLTVQRRHTAAWIKRSFAWMEAQLAEHNTEPNSGLGKAISYLLNHCTKLTLILRQAGAPSDNNNVERALKKAILNRKNTLFYKTLNGAGVGDLFMSLIHTWELNGANPFHCLTELLRHAEALKSKPSEWMPWNRRDTLEQLATTGVDRMAVHPFPVVGQNAGHLEIAWDGFCLAEEDRLRPCLGDAAKCLPSRTFQRQNPVTFLARHGRSRKCFVPAGTRVFPPTISRPPRCRTGAMREYAARRGWAIVLQIREVGSGAAKREAQEKLMEAARRREIDLVLVWRLDRWGRLRRIRTGDPG